MLLGKTHANPKKVYKQFFFFSKDFDKKTWRSKITKIIYKKIKQKVRRYNSIEFQNK